MSLRRVSGEEGFTMVELLVALGIFLSVSAGMFGMLFAFQHQALASRDQADSSQNARLGFARMVRDSREGQSIVAANPSSAPSFDGNSYEVYVDFDGNGTITPYPGTNSQGDYEDLTYSYDATSHEISLNGEVLMKHVYPIGTTPIFSFSSDHLEYDWNADGTTTWQELGAAAGSSHNVVGVGTNNGQRDDAELPLASNGDFALQVQHRCWS